jgi:hypothetical protein
MLPPSLRGRKLLGDSARDLRRGVKSPAHPSTSASPGDLMQRKEAPLEARYGLVIKSRSSTGD